MDRRGRVALGYETVSSILNHNPISCNCSDGAIDTVNLSRDAVKNESILGLVPVVRSSEFLDHTCTMIFTSPRRFLGVSTRDQGDNLQSKSQAAMRKTKTQTLLMVMTRTDERKNPIAELVICTRAYCVMYDLIYIHVSVYEWSETQHGTCTHHSGLSSTALKTEYSSRTPIDWNDLFRKYT